MFTYQHLQLLIYLLIHRTVTVRLFEAYAEANGRELVVAAAGRALVIAKLKFSGWS